MSQRNTPFFVHYLPLPPELRAFVIWLVFGLSVLTLILSIVVLLSLWVILFGIMVILLLHTAIYYC